MFNMSINFCFFVSSLCLLLIDFVSAAYICEQKVGYLTYKNKYCSNGCCRTDSYSPCCSIYYNTYKASVSTGGYVGIGISGLILIGIIVAVYYCVKRCNKGSETAGQVISPFPQNPAMGAPWGGNPYAYNNHVAAPVVAPQQKKKDTMLKDIVKMVGTSSNLAVSEFNEGFDGFGEE